MVWLVAGAMALCGTLVYGELAARYPEAGGGYVYLREAWGPRVAFLYGWKCCLVMDPGITAALATGPGRVSRVPRAAVAGGAEGRRHRRDCGRRRRQHRWRPAGRRRHLHAGACSSSARSRPSSSPASAWGAATGGTSCPSSRSIPGAAPLGGALAGAFVSAFFAFGGWWEAAKLTGEVRDPGHTMPRALTPAWPSSPGLHAHVGRVPLSRAA